MTDLTTDNRQLTTSEIAAIRHSVYTALLDYLPVASREQTFRMMANLRLRSELRRFLGLRVSPELAETNYRGASQREIEQWLNRKYGDLLAVVPGFYRRVDSGQWSVVSGQTSETGHRPPATDHRPPPPFRLNLPVGCALHGYRSPGGFFAGVLCQPLDRLNSFFLLSSSKYNGPKAAKLSGEDHMYFTQFEKVNA